MGKGKESDPNNASANASADASVDSRPTHGRQSADCRPTRRQLFFFTWFTADKCCVGGASAVRRWLFLLKLNLALVDLGVLCLVFLNSVTIWYVLAAVSLEMINVFVDAILFLYFIDLVPSRLYCWAWLGTRQVRGLYTRVLFGIAWTIYDQQRYYSY